MENGSTYQTTLAQHFKFTPQDLAHNRQGKLSKAQRNKLVGKISSKFIAILFSLLLTSVFFGYALLVATGTIALTGSENLRPIMPAAAVVFGAISSILTIREILAVRAVMKNMQAGTIGAQSGHVSSGTEQGTDHTFYYLLLNGQKFYIPKNAYKAFQEGSHRLYYTHANYKFGIGDSPIILAIEPL